MTLSSHQPFAQPEDFRHPEDALEAYALGALEPAEAAEVESHLESCFYCSRTLAGLEQAAYALSQAVPRQTPPPQLQSRLLESLPALPTLPEAAEPETAALPDAGHAAASRFNFSSFALPLAATLVIGLLSASLLMNVLTTNRLNGLERENAAAEVRISQLEQGHVAASSRMEEMAAGESHTAAALQQVMETNYLMAQPSTRPFRMVPARGGSQSEGLLLVNGDGRRAVLMLANMEPPPPARSYQVWLSRNGQKVPMGSISVDAAGWGAMELNLPESLYGFDWLNLTMEEPTVGEIPTGEMVLQSRIISPQGR